MPWTCRRSTTSPIHFSSWFYAFIPQSRTSSFGSIVLSLTMTTHLLLPVLNKSRGSFSNLFCFVFGSIVKSLPLRPPSMIVVDVVAILENVNYMCCSANKLVNGS
ncbi:hypothetical protein PanWU01x14_076450 [Parasponia andersonii]|uniref:Uncharacterized protein n=1 Tax=Parasponia andersonii TaxID=3476 RepID=A0A2P5DCC2_PARAD|nr:hypothetical protein PanWU01x14_076450 [Parasponia andersonii]